MSYQTEKIILLDKLYIESFNYLDTNRKKDILLSKHNDILNNINKYTTNRLIREFLRCFHNLGYNNNT